MYGQSNTLPHGVPRSPPAEQTFLRQTERSAAEVESTKHHVAAWHRSPKAGKRPAELGPVKANPGRARQKKNGEGGTIKSIQNTGSAREMHGTLLPFHRAEESRCVANRKRA